MIGGRVIENRGWRYECEPRRALSVRRLWVVNSMGDECAVYVDHTLGSRVLCGDLITWRGRVALWSRDGLFSEVPLAKHGHAHDPRGSRLLQLV